MLSVPSQQQMAANPTAPPNTNSRLKWELAADDRDQRYSTALQSAIWNGLNATDGGIHHQHHHTHATTTATTAVVVGLPVKTVLHIVYEYLIPTVGRLKTIITKHGSEKMSFSGAATAATATATATATGTPTKTPTKHTGSASIGGGGAASESGSGYFSRPYAVCRYRHPDARDGEEGVLVCTFGSDQLLYFDLRRGMCTGSALRARVLSVHWFADSMLSGTIWV